MTRPICNCHGEPMRWQAVTNRRADGYWRCAVKHREATQRVLATPEGLEANRARNRTRAAYISEIADWLIGNRCPECGTQDNLQAHHIDKETKTFSVSRWTPGMGVQALIEEINKCVRLCRRCHALEHAKRWAGP